MKRWLSVAGVVIAATWIGVAAVYNDQSIYTSGPMADAHERLTNDCQQCHTVGWRGLHTLVKPVQANRAMNEACLTCHDGSIGYHPGTKAARHEKTSRVASESPKACHHCHVEHDGRSELAATHDDRCTDCHHDLLTEWPEAAFSGSISSFHNDHPEFRILSSDRADPGRVQFSHVDHLKPNRESPEGPVQMKCADCHRAGPSVPPWPYTQAGLHGGSVGAAKAPAPKRRGAYMDPIRFSLHCIHCHELVVDSESKRFDGGAAVPHETPEMIQTFMRGRLTAHIQKHPEELTRIVDGATDYRPPLRTQTPAEIDHLSLEWVEHMVQMFEQKMYRDAKTCEKCHEQQFPADKAKNQPDIVPSQIPGRWFEHASFDHDRHRVSACKECHAMATTSTKASDVLLPGIETCRQCHAPLGGRTAPVAGGVADDCTTCHTYHRPPDASVRDRLLHELGLEGVASDPLARVSPAIGPESW